MRDAIAVDVGDELKGFRLRRIQFLLRSIYPLEIIVPMDFAGLEKIVGPLRDKPEALVGVIAIVATAWIVQSGVKDWLIILIPFAIFVLYCGTRIALAGNAERLRALDVREIEAKGQARVAELNAKRLSGSNRKAGS